MTKKQTKHRRRMRQLRAWLLLITMVVLVALAVVGVVSLVMPRYRYAPLDSHTSEDLGYERTFDKKIVNIALFGIDTREPDSFSGLSDCIMIVSVNTETKQVKLLSIMRDSLVRIEKNGKTSFGKINAVYQRGAAQSIRAINRNFGTDISDYVTVNFFGLAKIIDALGGVDITLTDEEIADLGPKRPTINFYIGEICAGLGVDPKDYYLTKSGTQHVNGVQAVAYSRIRYVRNTWGGSDDFGRTDRQRYVLEQLFTAAKTMPKSRCLSLIKTALPCIETSLTYGDMASLAVNVLLKQPSFAQMRIPRYEFLMDPPHGKWGSAVYYDLDYAAAVIKAVIYDDMTIDAFEEIRPVEKNDWYAKANGKG